MKKPKVDPRIDAASDKAEKAAMDFERWYARMRRALAKMEKARKARVRHLNTISRIKRELREQQAAAEATA